MKAHWEFFGYVAAIIVGALIIARLVITIIRRIKAVGGGRGEPRGLGTDDRQVGLEAVPAHVRSGGRRRVHSHGAVA